MNSSADRFDGVGGECVMQEIAEHTQENYLGITDTHQLETRFAPSECNILVAELANIFEYLSF